MDAAALIERLIDLAERQRLAAVAFDVIRVDELTRSRADVLFELQIAVQGGMSDETRNRVQVLLPRMQQAERRLAGVVGAVARALQPIPKRPSTYGRRGLLQAR